MLSQKFTYYYIIVLALVYISKRKKLSNDMCDVQTRILSEKKKRKISEKKKNENYKKLKMNNFVLIVVCLGIAEERY